LNTHLDCCIDNNDSSSSCVTTGTNGSGFITTAIDYKSEDGTDKTEECDGTRVEAVESWESGEESVASTTTSSSLQESVLLRYYILSIQYKL
jgi:hypothetical protein